MLEEKEQAYEELKKQDPEATPDDKELVALRH